MGGPVQENKKDGRSMNDLAQKVDQMYHMLAEGMNTKQHNHEDEENADDIISKLRFIESRLLHYAEIRDYLTHGLKPNDYSAGRIDPQLIPQYKIPLAIGVFELEKQIEKTKK